MIPNNEVIICEPVEATLKSGLTVVNDKEPELGKVIAIGKGKLPLKLTKGDVIVFEKYMDNKINVGGKELNFVKFKHVLAKV